jgi:hypothetical protein
MAPTEATPTGGPPVVWLALNWDSINAGVESLHTGLEHPVNIRQACREAGYEWALDQAARCPALIEVRRISA